MAPTQAISGRALAAGQWFLQSGIQEANGGVARYYRADLGQNAPISTEITGYSVSALAFLYRRTGDGQHLDAARRSARFLMDNVWNPELRVFPFEYPEGAGEPLTYDRVSASCPLESSWNRNMLDTTSAAELARAMKRPPRI